MILLKVAVNLYLSGFAAENTRRAYRTALGHFCEHVGPNKPLLELRLAHLNSFIADEPYLRVVRGFWAWLFNHLGNQMDLSQRPIRFQVADPALAVTDAQLAALMLATKSPRNRAILMTMSECGLLPSAIAELKSSEVDWAARSILALDEHGVRRRMYLPDHDSVLRWYRGRPASEYFFCSSQGAGLSDYAVRIIIYRAAQVSGVKVSATGFYHRVACIFSDQLLLSA